jgi:hypothetical protein
MLAGRHTAYRWMPISYLKLFAALVQIHGYQWVNL